MTVAAWYAQSGHGVRFDWGPTGAERLRQLSACLVVVDVLSFTTAVTVAVEAGMAVLPYRWRDETAVAFAEARGASLAVGRSEVSAESPWSLSPAALRRAPAAARLVLPSPNGSTIAAAAASEGATVVAGCLRNARAVGRWLAGHGFGTPERAVTVIAAGERWPDESLRPALEDQLGAGAIIGALLDAVAGSRSMSLSPEALAAHRAYQSLGDVVATVQDCASGRELVAYGYREDVSIAAEIDGSDVVPVLTDDGFVAAAGRATAARS